METHANASDELIDSLDLRDVILMSDSTGAGELDKSPARLAKARGKDHHPGHCPAAHRQL
jgi:hypothetical protein